MNFLADTNLGTEQQDLLHIAQGLTFVDQIFVDVAVCGEQLLFLINDILGTQYSPLLLNALRYRKNRGK
jgi:hypothetical protein